MLLSRTLSRPLKLLTVTLPLITLPFLVSSTHASGTCTPSAAFDPGTGPIAAIGCHILPDMSSTEPIADAVVTDVNAAAAIIPEASAAETPELPVLFLSHCAPILLMGPSNIFGRPNNCHSESEVAAWYSGLAKQLDLAEGARRPKALVLLSAHWETSEAVRITAQDRHPTLYYDYYGFPKHTYEVKYPAPGSVKLAGRIQSLLQKAGINAELDTKRNIDHGGFIPLMHMYPDADIPVLQISIFRHFDPETHLRIGHALATLRKEGVLLVGSGQATHGAFDNPPEAMPPTAKFVDALTQGMANKEAAEAVKAGTPLADSGAESLEDMLASQRGQTIINWRKLPHAALAHPRPDHFIPISLVVGAARSTEPLYQVGDHWIADMHSLRTFAYGNVGTSKKNKIVA